MNRKSRTPDSLQAVSRDDMQRIVGGAETFLRGTVTQPTHGGLTPIVNERELNLAVKSVPLTCCNECTLFLSGC